MSIDFGLMARLIVDAFDKKEKFDEGSRQYVDLQGIVDFTDVQKLESKLSKKDVLSIVSILFSLAFGAIALYLSWTCNTAVGYGPVLKAIYGSTAFVFGFTYIILYLFLRYDTCMVLMKK